MKFSSKPKLFIITGSNGAGKSTYKQALLPPAYRDLEIFDGDIFYTQKSAEFYKVNKSSKESRKLAEEALEQEFLRFVEISISKKSSFAMRAILRDMVPGKFRKGLKKLNLKYILFSVG